MTELENWASEWIEGLVGESPFGPGGSRQLEISVTEGNSYEGAYAVISWESVVEGLQEIGEPDRPGLLRKAYTFECRRGSRDALQIVSVAYAGEQPHEVVHIAVPVRKRMFGRLAQTGPVERLSAELDGLSFRLTDA